MATKTIKQTLPVVKVLSKYFATKTINVERGLTPRFGDYPAGVKIKFDADGIAEINPEQADLIAENSSYNPFVTVLDSYEREFEHETEADEV